MITCDNGCGTRAPMPWWVSMRWLAGAARVCLSVLLCECTNNARDCCDEVSVLQLSLRSLRSLAICCLWKSVTSPPWTDKRRFGEGFFFYFCQCGGFASNRGARSIECMFFSPFLPFHNLFFWPYRSIERRHLDTTQSQARKLQTLRTQLRSWH